MALLEELEQLWGVTIDDGKTFIDEDGQLCGVRLWMSHSLCDSKEEATKRMQKFKDDYPNQKVVKITFSLKVTKF